MLGDINTNLKLSGDSLKSGFFLSPIQCHPAGVLLFFEPMKTFRNPFLWITVLVLLSLSAFAQEAAPLPAAPTEAVPPWAQVFAVAMAFLVATVALARVIVMFTPTNKDNEFVEKTVAVLKKIGLHISLLVLCGLLAMTAATTTGCRLFSGKSPVTWEASRYGSFRDTWTLTLALYDHAKDLQVAGKITAADAADIDAAFNLFRIGFKQALGTAQGDENAFTPESVKVLANNVLTLIYAAQ